MDDEHLPLTGPDRDWWHVNIAFHDKKVTKHAAAELAALLTGVRYHFLRKDGGLRLRTHRSVADVLDTLVARETIESWNPGVYEPETTAFGGHLAMDLAHELFCADSGPGLAELGIPGGRERCVLLLSTMYRAAGLDPFETGDVWVRLAALRPPVAPPTGAVREKAVAAMRRLMYADAAQRQGAELGWGERVAAFEHAGRQLRRLNSAGDLIRGLRAVLAHHAVFAFNRAGVTPEDQAATAWLGGEVVFGDTESDALVSTAWSGNRTRNLARMESTLSTTAEPSELRNALVDRLIDNGRLHSPEVIAAFRVTERERYLPGVDVQTAYTEDAVPTKYDEDGEMISCISAPSVVAAQLEQLEAQPGHKVLEAGAATGYNAALLSRLVSPGGQVWTLDVDQDLVDGAAKNLAQTGVDNATAVLGDAAVGLPEHAPYDRIQFTVGTGDIPVKILDQIAPGGRLVLPMRIRGSISRSFAFERDGQTWKTSSDEMSTFVPLRKGICDDVYTRVQHDGDGDVRLETFSEQQVDREAMRTVLDQPSVKQYTGVKFYKGAPFEWLYLYLACVLPNGLSRLPGSRAGFTPHFGWGSMAALDGDSLAYMTIREGENQQGKFWELGIVGHGSRAADLTERVVMEVRAWDEGWGNDGPRPGFRMAVGDMRHRLTAADPRFVVDKSYSRLVVDWPRKG
ncbi:methyltransferase, FxLD system [Streptacidiphilus jiangxiensis]|uniref:Protein-L-isoaspartate O-methyltransferase n=1 Tax=Streptacidiphilus jiangxiensis TaxID=235985 RepID=A0A1H7H3P8_STRJI|nr:methyltransferase, FxLD system [Streptacidiphilus jiangxiensis]SEK44387.1 protein-L-isoaspartate(D-aspartate) O-methyltransferase [Streptacidiphilus jiangxiensis]